ncbi:MAG: hypothetical protein QXJ28_00235 [Candidatus Pacearchaeota archaeon]
MIKLIEREKDLGELIIISHLEIVNDLPRYYLTEKLKREYRGEEIKKGQAFCLDLRTKRYGIIPQESE